MPLEPGRTKEAIAKNIRLLISEGYPRKQAIAIAMRKAKRPRRPSARRGRD